MPASLGLCENRGGLGSRRLQAMLRGRPYINEMHFEVHQLGKVACCNMCNKENHLESYWIIQGH